MTFCVVRHVEVKNSGLLYVCRRCGETFTWEKFIAKGGVRNSGFKKEGQEFAQQHRECLIDKGETE